MTQDTVRALADGELSQVALWAEEEIKARAEKRKQKAIAEIKARAAEVGITVVIGGVRGRPSKVKPERPAGKT